VIEICTENGQCLLRVNVSNDRQISFDKKRHSCMWNEFDFVEQTVHSFEFVFHNQLNESDFKKLLAIKMFESSREERFEDAVSVSFQV
jgi:hypothetical protein